MQPNQRILMNSYWLTVITIFFITLPVRSDDHKQVATRLFIQDYQASTLQWFDVQESEKGEITFGKVKTVEGFPKLDAKQRLVQMKLSEGTILVGIRDLEDGVHGSGWTIFQTGAKYADHGDHGHWKYKKQPRIITTVLDKDQGNPAHVYVYDKRFYVANDKKNGYTRVDPDDFYISKGGDVKTGNARFLPGGGNHITLATVNDRVGYGCWIDGGGPNQGKVDVTDLTGGSIRYSFKLPTGVIHGAATVAGKVFFAPADGICWVNADEKLQAQSNEVKINHISLGKSGEKPNRTGAFASHGKHLFCVTGKNADSKLVILDSSANQPEPIMVPLTGKPDQMPLTPSIVMVHGKTPMAFVFHDHPKDVDVKDHADVIQLDPNLDGKFDDAKLFRSIEVGSSAVEGHTGHHDIAFDADGRYGYFINPGDSTLTVLDLKSLTFKGSLKLPGKPNGILAHGGKDLDE
jgi:hypothetical protein